MLKKKLINNMCAKFWYNDRAAQPDHFPNQVIYACFQCNDAYIGSINYCPKCEDKLIQIYPFNGGPIKECSAIQKPR